MNLLLRQSVLLLSAIALTGSASTLFAGNGNRGNKDVQTPVLPAPSAEVVSLLEKSNGQLTAPIRIAYLKWAEHTSLSQLEEGGKNIPPDCLGEINANADLKDAMFAAVYPPDPSIVQNYAELRRKLGPAFMTKYRSLVIAVSVAKRIGHVDADGEALAMPPTEPGKSYYTANPAAEGDPSAQMIADYMKRNAVAAIDLNEDGPPQEKLVGYLKSQNVKPETIAKDLEPKRLAGLLKRAMIILGQRPKSQGDRPAVVDWLKYLASVYESTPATTPMTKGKKPVAMSWPLFPMGRAPWPLLMPLAREYPLNEARDIFNTFQGHDGPARFITYGNYRKPPVQLSYELKPSTLYWETWEDRLVHGGECVVMSAISVESHITLDQPSISAGQPGHSNLITYKSDQNAWYADVEQAYAGGPDVTHSAWLFKAEPFKILRLNPKGDGGAEYHLGLAAAMNVGVKSFMDTRIAVNIFAMLSEEQRLTTGAKLLHSAIEINPYNPEPWYLLASQTIDATHGLPLATAAKNQDPGGTDSNTPVSQSLESFTEREYSKPVEAANRKYWRTLEEFVVTEAILRHPMPTADADARKIYQFLKTDIPGITPFQMSPYMVRFEGAVPVTAPEKAGKK